MYLHFNSRERRGVYTCYRRYNQFSNTPCFGNVGGLTLNLEYSPNSPAERLQVVVRPGSHQWYTSELQKYYVFLLMHGIKSDRAVMKS